MSSSPMPSSRGEPLVEQASRRGKKLLAKAGQKAFEGTKKVLKKCKSLAVAFVKNPRVVAQWYGDIREAVIHFVQWVKTGFRLFGADVRASWYLMKRVVSGYPLSLRERNLLVRTTSDCVKLIPFSFFIIVPFAELALPLFLRLFPNMLPSTFFQQKYDNATLARKLKAKQEMAEFWQQVVHQRTKEIIDSDDYKYADKAEELKGFQEKLLEGREYPSLKEIMKFSKLFEKELSLTSMSNKQLSALSRALQLPQVRTWWKGHMEVQLRHHITQLRREDRDYLWEGIDTLSTNELIEACKKRNIRFHEVTEDEMRRDLARWLELSANKKVPTLALLWIQSFYLRGQQHVPDLGELAMDVKPPTPEEEEEANAGDKAFGGMAERQKASYESAQQKLKKLEAELDEVMKSEVAILLQVAKVAKAATEQQPPPDAAAAAAAAEGAAAEGAAAAAAAASAPSVGAADGGAAAASPEKIGAVGMAPGAGVGASSPSIDIAIDKAAASAEAASGDSAAAAAAAAAEAATKDDEDLGESFEEQCEEKTRMTTKLKNLNQSLKLYKEIASMQKVLLDKQLKLLCAMRNNAPCKQKDADVILLDQRVRLVEMVKTFEGSMKDIEDVMSRAYSEQDEEAAGESGEGPRLGSSLSGADVGLARKGGPANWDDLDAAAAINAANAANAAKGEALRA